MTSPIVNPEIPYDEEIPGGLQPGKMLRLQGVTHPEADRFNINLQTGPSVKPRDDTALHLSVRLNQGYIARNSYRSGNWEDEDGSGQLPIGKCQSWEIIILVDEQHYKIAINGQHFCEFSHRIPFKDVTHLVIDGDVSITLISWEGVVGTAGNEVANRASELNSEGPQIPPPMGNFPPPGGYSSPPMGGYGPPPGNYGYGVPPPPGAQAESGFGGFLGQAQEVLAGAIKSGAAEKLLSSFFSSGQPQQQQGYTHQNAKYGIYPALPQEDDLNTRSAPVNQNQGYEGILSNLLTGGNKQQQTPQNTSNSTPLQQNQQPLDISSLLSSLLNPKQPQGSVPNTDVDGKQNIPREQQSQNVDWSGILGSLISGGNPTNSQSNVPIEQRPKPEMHMQQNIPMNQQNQNVDLGALLGGLISGNKSEKTAVVDSQSSENNQQSKGIDLNTILSGLASVAAAQTVTRPIQPNDSNQNQNDFTTQQSNQQSFGRDLGHLLTGILSNNTSHPNQTGAGPYNNQTGMQQNPPVNQPTSNIPGNQQQKGFDLGSLLNSLLTPQGPPNQFPGNPNQYGGSNPSVLPGAGHSANSQAHQFPIPPSQGNPQKPDNANERKSTLPASQEQVEDVSDKLAEVIASEKSSSQQNSSHTQQYGQYPHQQNTQGQGPVENLLSSFLGGGGQTHSQQQPNFGGGDSIGGLGSMSGLLQNFAGQILQPKDHNQRQNF